MLQMKKSAYLSLSGLFMAAVLLLLINLVSSFLFSRVQIDLTENRLYTLSQGTKNILRGLEEPITFRFYFSEKIFSNQAEIKSYGARVRELLKEYANLSDGKLRLIVVDPEPFSEAEDAAVNYGLQGYPVDNEGNNAYFGLVASNSTDDQESIPFFLPNKEESLEYDLTKLVHKLSNPKLANVAMISGLPVLGGAAPAHPGAPPSAEWFVIDQISQSFHLNPLGTDIERIPENTDVLLLIHPKALAEKTLMAIDQFVVNGGHALIFVDPYSEADVTAPDPNNPMAAFQAPRHSTLTKLFDAWGIELNLGSFVADRQAASRVSVNNGGHIQAVDYLAWLSLDQSHLNHKDFVTSDLDKLVMATAGSLKKKQGAEITFDPLVQSSAQSMLMKDSFVRFSPNPVQMLQQFKSDNQVMTLAARISGKLKSAFAISDKENEKPATAEANIIVVADTDMLVDRMWVDLQNFFGKRLAVPRAANGAFVINALDNLSGSNDLISLRSRGKSARPFTKVEALQREAETAFRDKEKTLQDRLQQTERKLAELQQQKGADGALILSEQQQQEIEQFRREMLNTRKELRNVRHELNKSIESLGAWLKFVNIALIPLLILVVATVLSIYRARRLRIKH